MCIGCTISIICTCERHGASWVERVFRYADELGVQKGEVMFSTALKEDEKLNTKGNIPNEVLEILNMLAGSMMVVDKF